MAFVDIVSSLLNRVGSALGFNKNAKKGAGVLAEQKKILDDEQKKRQSLLDILSANMTGLSGTFMTAKDKRNKFGL